MLRASAKSMALIEAADDYFDQISARTRHIDLPIDEAKKLLALVYERTLHVAPKYEKSSSLILDALKGALDENLERDLEALIASDGYIVDRINERAEEQSLYRQPVILFIYLLVKNRPAYLREYWPFGADEIRPLYVDLGVAFGAGR